MGIQDIRFLRWASNQFYAANGSGNAWRDGNSSTKLEPDAIDYAEGFANDRDTRAEVVNYLINQHDVLRSSLALDRLTRFRPEIGANVDRPPAVYSNQRVVEYQGSQTIYGEVFAGVYSERLAQFVSAALNDAAIIIRRAPGGELLSESNSGAGHSGNWQRGAYVRGSSPATSFSVLMNVGNGNALCTIPDTGAAVMTTAVAGHTVVDAEPIAQPQGGLSGRVSFLTTNAGNTIFFNRWTQATGTGAVTVTSTGLTTTGEGTPQLHRLPSGRWWVTTSRRAAYSDNDGATWAFDGAAAGSDQGVYVWYDVDNARWLRASAGAPFNLRVAVNPNNPTASAALKTIAGLALYHGPIAFGRYLYSLALSGGVYRPVISPDYGITWLTCNQHFKHFDTAEGTLGRPLVAGISSMQISANAIGVTARLRTVTALHLLVLEPLADADGSSAFR